MEKPIDPRNDIIRTELETIDNEISLAELLKTCEKYRINSDEVFLEGGIDNIYECGFISLYKKATKLKGEELTSAILKYESDLKLFEKKERKRKKAEVKNYQIHQLSALENKQAEIQKQIDFLKRKI